MLLNLKVLAVEVVVVVAVEEVEEVLEAAVVAVTAAVVAAVEVAAMEVEAKAEEMVHPPPTCRQGITSVDCGGGGVSHKDFCRTHPGAFGCHRHHDNDVKVIHKTVVVHDNNNTPQTIIVNTNAAGTCFITQTQIVNIPGLVAQLLGQCASVTIIPG
jgi:hypothetical protein